MANCLRHSMCIIQNVAPQQYNHDFDTVQSELLFNCLGNPMLWYGMVWYGMVWYGMVWYGMAWQGTV